MIQFNENTAVDENLTKEEHLNYLALDLAIKFCQATGGNANYKTTTLEHNALMLKDFIRTGSFVNKAAAKKQEQHVIKFGKNNIIKSEAVKVDHFLDISKHDLLVGNEYSDDNLDDSSDVAVNDSMYYAPIVKVYDRNTTYQDLANDGYKPYKGQITKGCPYEGEMFDKNGQTYVWYNYTLREVYNPYLMNKLPHPYIL